MLHEMAREAEGEEVAAKEICSMPKNHWQWQEQNEHDSLPTWPLTTKA